MDDLVAGLAVLLGVLLFAAGVPKVVAPRYAGSAVRRVIRRRDLASDTVILVGVRALGAWEIALAAALVSGRWPVWIATATVLTFVGFLGFVVAAVRRGASCGCWASLTEGPAGGAEIARTALLLGYAGFVLVGRSLEYSGRTVAALGWAAVGFAGLMAAAAIGGLVAPVRAERVVRQLRYQAPASRTARFGVWLGFLGGFVHAGTDAGRRRYALARNAPGRVGKRSLRRQRNDDGGRAGSVTGTELGMGAVPAAHAQPALPAVGGAGER
ncbi:MauE/DoxX family redox-associated membrane protein [Actinophytocola sp.]|uniref:MauE/DoxX family redox-associated membrane protein n=1 Tax=Actinophytocola sp. TaxID=1872138 RepID=UPI002D7EF9BE|nr:MauE/DoxX family redox-associated membrane protein [Actinophytocola sp.]HET9141635.1 MauE/DoxX family redox-associated membrane protein [Actinophytocola sp.]